MNSKLTTISVHIIGWCLLLVMPLAISHEHMKTFLPSVNEVSFTPILLISGINIAIFYFNYFYLVPKFLFAKQYLTYGFTFLGCLLISYIFGFVLFDLQGPTIISTLIYHTAKGNMFQMLIVSAATSMVLAYGNRLKQIEKEHLSAQLASLRSQINPHFLFNTLNSIYAATLSTSPKSADMVERLSNMMRYTTKGNQRDFVNLDDEIRYSTDYIELQRIRTDGSVRIGYVNSVGPTTLQIAPMLLIPFIENAFKHGIHPEKDSEISIVITLKKTELKLLVRNDKVEVQVETSEESGLGIENTKRRLQFIYPGRHQLCVKETAGQFEVELKIDLS